MTQGGYRFCVASLGQYGDVVACGGSVQSNFLTDCEVFRIIDFSPLTFAWAAGVVADLPSANSNFGMFSLNSRLIYRWPPVVQAGIRPSRTSDH